MNGNCDSFQKQLRVPRMPATTRDRRIRVHGYLLRVDTLHLPDVSNDDRSCDDDLPRNINIYNPVLVLQRVGICRTNLCDWLEGRIRHGGICGTCYRNERYGNEHDHNTPIPYTHRQISSQGPRRAIASPTMLI